ncbi:MAG: hypothetical protein ACUVX1_13010 [Chloroflexota bacterium]
MAYVVAGQNSMVKTSTELTARQRAQAKAELKRLCQQPREVDDLQGCLAKTFPELWERLHWRAVEELCQELVAEGVLEER